MSDLQLPFWSEILIALLLIVGSLLTLIGSLGMWRLQSFYQRLHGPTLGATMGMYFLLLASMLFFAMTGLGPSWHEILIAIFLVVTVPVTTMVLARAALYRHRRSGKDVPDRHNLRGGSSTPPQASPKPGAGSDEE